MGDNGRMAGRILFWESSQLAQKPSRSNQIQPTQPNTGSPQYRLAPVVLPVSDTLPTRPNSQYRLARPFLAGSQ